MLHCFISWISDPNNLTAVSTSIIAIFTVALVLVGWRQAWLTRQAIIEANKQHIVSNRAFVFLKTFITLATGAKKGTVDYWRITPVFENSGSSATKEMISGHSAELRDSKLPDNFTYPDTSFPPSKEPFFLSRDIIGPHAQLNGAPYILSIADIQAVARMEKKFFVWGWSEYNDIFDGSKRHRTEYCYQLVVLLDPTNADNSGALAMGQFGPYNAVDEQCSRQAVPFMRA